MFLCNMITTSPSKLPDLFFCTSRIFKCRVVVSLRICTFSHHISMQSCTLWVCSDYKWRPNPIYKQVNASIQEEWKKWHCCLISVSLRARCSLLNPVTLSLSNAQWADSWNSPWGAGTATLPLRCLVLRVWWHIKTFHEGHKGLRNVHSQWWVRQTTKTDSVYFIWDEGTKSTSKNLNQKTP